MLTLPHNFPMYLGIDIGTSAVKAVLLAQTGAMAAEAAAPLEVSRPRALWSEQSPEDWWQATVAAVRSLPAPLRAAVRAVGLSGQMHGATLLDAQHRPLRPAILWNDGRSARECRELESAVPRLGAITGNRAMPGFTAPKLAWVRRHEPAVFAAVEHVLLPKDYVRLCLTGELASDLSDSAGTLWLDVAQREWSDEMLSATGLSRRHMPRLHEGTEATGRLLPSAASSLGLPTVEVFAGGGDNAAGAVGAGVVRPGEAFLSLGTSGVLFLACAGYRPDASRGVHTFCHAVPGQWHQMSVILSAASCLDWAARATGATGPGELMAEVEARGRPAGSEIFLPYLSGERTPHNDPNAQGVLFGLTHDSDRAALGQAVLEGVAFAFRDGLDALLATGNPVHSIAVIGGGARSRYWGRILASVLERPLDFRDGSTVGAACGAARLAWMGHEGLDPMTAASPPALLDTVLPDASFTEVLIPRLERYRALYAALHPHFPE